MDTTQSILTLPVSDVAEEVADAVRRYESQLLTPGQAAAGLAAMKHLVLACGPLSITDAKSMLATAARFFGDVAEPDGLDVDRFLTDFEVSRWLHTKLREGTPPQTLANHRQRLARFLRVRRGLPARMAVRGVAKQPHAPLDDETRADFEDSLDGADPSVVAAYVAAVGTGRVASEAVGASVLIENDEFWLVRDDERWAIVSELSALAAAVAGVPVGGGAWKALRAHAAEHGVALDRHVARSTFTVLALGEDEAPVALIRRFGVTRRAIESAAEFLPPVDAAVAAAVLRG